MDTVHKQIVFRQSTFHLDLMQSNFTEKSRRKISLMKQGRYQLNFRLGSDPYLCVRCRS